MDGEDLVKIDYIRIKKTINGVRLEKNIWCKN